MQGAVKLNTFQLHYQVVLLEYRCESINQDIELSYCAVSGLTDVFCKMYDYAMKYSK